MKNYYIHFTGTPNQLYISLAIFKQVSQLNYNTRPLKEYNYKNNSRIIEFPATMKKFKEFYQVALRRLYAEPDYNGGMPRVVVPN